MKLHIVTLVFEDENHARMLEDTAHREGCVIVSSIQDSFIFGQVKTSNMQSVNIDDKYVTENG